MFYQRTARSRAEGNGYRVEAGATDLVVQDLHTGLWAWLEVKAGRLAACSAPGRDISWHPWLAEALKDDLRRDSASEVAAVVDTLTAPQQRAMPPFPVPTIDAIHELAFPVPPSWLADFQETEILSAVSSVAVALAWRGGRAPAFEVAEALRDLWGVAAVHDTMYAARAYSRFNISAEGPGRLDAWTLTAPWRRLDPAEVVLEAAKSRGEGRRQTSLFLDDQDE